jgi:hypothetical protein
LDSEIGIIGEKVVVDGCKGGLSLIEEADDEGGVADD